MPTLIIQTQLSILQKKRLNQIFKKTETTKLLFIRVTYECINNHS